MKKVVVVGGGVAGKVLLDNLIKKSNIDLILIEPKDYIEVPFARLRALVEPDDFSLRIRENYSQLLPTLKHIKMKAVAIKDKAVLIEDGSKVDFDYLVIATGAKFIKWPYLNSDELDMKLRQDEVVKEASKIKKANSIMIIGGGSVGVELAGEIAYRWNNKRITIVNSSDRLLNSLSKKMSIRAEKVLNDLNVKIINSTRLSNDESDSWCDESGKVFNYDLVIQAVGTSIESSWISTYPEIKTTDKGAIKVDSSFRTDKNNIFAIGDITDIPELKLGAFATKHSKITAKNIIRLIDNPSAKLLTYKPGKPLSMIPIGKKKGAVQLPFAHPHFLIVVKQKDLFISKIF